MSFGNRESFTYSFSISISFSGLIAVAKTAKIMLNSSGESGHPCLLPDIRGNAAIQLLGIHTEETRIERDMCTPMFITALFIIAKTWKQPGCPSADEWIRKLWYIYTMEYFHPPH